MNSLEQEPLLNDRFKFLENLGKGSFGNVYRVYDTKKKIHMAVKTIFTKPRNPQIAKEVFTLRTMSKVKGFPRFYRSLSDNYCQYLFIELLSKNLQEMFYINKKHFELDRIVNLAIQMVQRVRSLHKRNIIHRDLKPQEFLLGHKSPCLLYLIDFGLIKFHSEPFSYSENEKFVGTPYYASLNTHIGISESKRDDLESLCYIFSFFIKGTLPWVSVHNKGSKAEISMYKNKTTAKELFGGAPVEFEYIFEYVKSLEFRQDPDYDYIIGLLKEVRRSYCLCSCLNWEKNWGTLMRSNVNYYEKDSCRNMEKDWIEMEGTVVEEMVCYHLMEKTVVCNKLPDLHKCLTISTFK